MPCAEQSDRRICGSNTVMAAIRTHPALRMSGILLLAFTLLGSEGRIGSLASGQEPRGMSDEQFTPVIQTILSTPRWFKGADERFHLDYELLLTNASPVTVTEVEVIVAGSGTSVAALGGEGLTAA